MRSMTGSIALRAAANVARAALADKGDRNSAILLYSEQGGTLLAVCGLAKPCGATNPEGRLVLSRGDDDLVLTTGSITFAEWRAGDGTVLSADTVTDEAGKQSDGTGGLIDTGGIGPWVLRGTNGTMVYEGGIVALTTGVIG